MLIFLLYYGMTTFWVVVFNEAAVPLVHTSTSLILISVPLVGAVPNVIYKTPWLTSIWVAVPTDVILGTAVFLVESCPGTSGVKVTVLTTFSVLSLNA
jgi:hypothetical protein